MVIGEGDLGMQLGLARGIGQFSVNELAMATLFVLIGSWSAPGVGQGHHEVDVCHSQQSNPAWAVYARQSIDQAWSAPERFVGNFVVPQESEIWMYGNSFVPEGVRQGVVVDVFRRDDLFRLGGGECSIGIARNTSELWFTQIGQIKDCRIVFEAPQGSKQKLQFSSEIFGEFRLRKYFSQLACGQST